MKFQSKVIVALAILVSTGCACLAGGEKADGNKQSHSPQSGGCGNHFFALLNLSFHPVLLLFVKAGY